MRYRKYQKQRSILESFQLLKDKAQGKFISVEEIIKILEGRGQSLILLFLSLPFCQPISLPGFSTPFGSVIALIGLRMSFGKNIWLPKKVLKKSISVARIHKLSNIGIRVINKLSFLIHPRLGWICHHPVMRVVNGFIICALGIFLALPLPLPGSNVFAAWAVFLIALGILEDDGLFILVGHVVLFAGIALFVWAVLFLKAKLIMQKT